MDVDTRGIQAVNAYGRGLAAQLTTVLERQPVIPSLGDHGAARIANAHGELVEGTDLRRAVDLLGQRFSDVFDRRGGDVAVEHEPGHLVDREVIEKRIPVLVVVILAKRPRELGELAVIGELMGCLIAGATAVEVRSLANKPLVVGRIRLDVLLPVEVERGYVVRNLAVRVALGREGSRKVCAREPRDVRPGVRAVDGNAIGS